MEDGEEEEEVKRETSWFLPRTTDGCMGDDGWWVGIIDSGSLAAQLLYRTFNRIQILFIINNYIQVK